MDSRDQRIAELQSQLAMLEEARQEDRRSMTQHLRELQQQLRGKDESLRNTTAEARHWEDQANQLYNSMVTEQTRNNDQIRQLEERCATSTSKLEQKDSELNSVKALLSTRNESSDAEIVKGLDHVNNLIEEMTRQYSHHFLSLPVKGMPVKSADPVPSLFHEALGDDLLQLMDAIPTGGSFAPFVLQIAWQGILGRATWWAMEMFQITHWNGPPKYHLMNKLGAEIESSGEILEISRHLSKRSDCDDNREPTHVRPLASNNQPGPSEHHNTGYANEEPRCTGSTSDIMLSPRIGASVEACVPFAGATVGGLPRARS